MRRKTGAMHPHPPSPTRASGMRSLTFIAWLPVVAMLLFATTAPLSHNEGWSFWPRLPSVCAQTPPAALPDIYQFDWHGILESATVDDPSDVHSGGTLRVGGQTVVVPANTVVTLPAASFTWQGLFALAPAPHGMVASPPCTGLALDDHPKPDVTFQAHVLGNTVRGTAIAGLIFLSHDFLFASSGIITHMDYASGDLWVGGSVVGQPGGVRIRLNDPALESLDGSGRFGRPNGATVDRRWQVDQDNPTISSATSYPMCFPRVDPAVEDDPQCPRLNRPRDAQGRPLQSFQTAHPDTNAFPNPRFQAPLMVGDFINYAGTLMTLSDEETAGETPTPADPAAPVEPVAPADPADPAAPAEPVDPTDPASPSDPAAPSMAPAALPQRYISAHTISSNVAIFTFPGTWPAYVSVEVTLLGVGGVTIGGQTEASVATRFEGSTTDSAAIIQLFGVDYDAATGEAHDRPWGRVGVDPGPPNGEARGRWRFRPPCEAAPGLPTEEDCEGPAAHTFLPAPREVRAVISGALTLPVSDTTRTAANGIVAGQYRAPIFEYIFTENRPGTPLVSNAFEGLPFLVDGGSASSLGSAVAGQLSPWPGLQAPTPGSGGCASPVAQAGGPYALPAGGSLTLAGSVSRGTPPIAALWSLLPLEDGAAAGASGPGSLQRAASLDAQYTAPADLIGGGTVRLRLTLSNACGSSAADATALVSPSTLPTMQLPAAAVTAAPGQPLTIQLRGVEPDGLPLIFAVAPAADDGGGAAAVAVTVTATGGDSATAALTTPSLNPNAVSPLVLRFAVTATSPVGPSPAVPLTVTVQPPPDTILLVTQYRTEKLRLIIEAASSVVSPDLQITLLPYTTVDGLTFDPALLGGAFTNLGAGVHELVLVGAPQPAGATLVAESNLGGRSPPTAVQRLRE